MILHLVLGDNNPILATGGQIAAIVIGLYALVFILIALVFNFAMAFAASWVREKANLIKMLRPTVESVNKTSEALVDGTSPPANDNKIVRTVAEGPARVHTLDKQTDQLADKVANGAIEFRARTMQVQTVVKAFFAPKLLQRELEQHDQGLAAHNATEIKSPGYQMLMGEKAPDAPVVPMSEPAHGYSQTVTPSQLRDVPSR